MPSREKETCLSQLPPAARGEVENFIEFYQRFMSSRELIESAEGTGLPLTTIIGAINAGLRTHLIQSQQALTK